ncbi:MAG: helix-turn-helix domain-containing protein [Hassallia sp. WJT32-NPBG1]|nr:helix-turn-helix domain-containing protein [Hassallia sp. WJT32-NPBG1]
MKVEQFATNAQVFQKRLAGLQETTKALSWISPDLLPQACKELIATSNTLGLAAEQLYQQNEELIRTLYLLEEECQTYEGLFELTSDAYLVSNTEGIIEEANSAACDLLACSKQLLVGKPIVNFVSLEECQRFPSEMQISQSQKTRELVPLNQRKNNSSYVALTVGVVKNKQGKPQMLHWLMREKIEYQPVELAPLNAPLNYECNDYDITQNRPVDKYCKGETIPLNPLVICYVRQGTVKLTTFCETGEEVMLGLATPDMVFGSSITSLKTYQAIALSDVELVTIYEAEIAANPFLSSTILPKIKERLRQTESFLFILGKRLIEDRLQHFLLLLKEEIGEKTAKGTRISIRFTHEEIASACCTTRVTITRLMSKLQQQGFLTFDSKHHIIIKDVL